MRLRWAALVLVLALGWLVPDVLLAQTATSSQGLEEAQAELGQNYPNPFSTDTRIPFVVGDAPQCSDPGKLHRVSLRVYNILSQLVAIPVLQGGGGTVASGQPVDNVMLPCDRYIARWDGRDASSREVTPGAYIYRLEVDGKPYVKKMWVAR